MTFATYPGFELFTPVINAAGETAFYGALADGRLGLWSEGSGRPAMVVADQVHSPVLPADVHFDFASIDVVSREVWTDFPHLNDAGQVVVSVAIDGPLVSPSTDMGVWLGRDLSDLEWVNRKGNRANGLASNVRFHASLPFGLNDAGQAALISLLQGTGVDDTNDYGLWVGTADELEFVARKGDPAPVTPSGARFGALFAPIGMNNLGQVAFESFLTGSGVREGVNDEALWSNVSGQLELVARRGSQAAGLPEGVNYGMFSLSSHPLLNDLGQVAFHAGIEGAGVDETNNEGIWLGSPGNLALVARMGQPVPDLPGEVNFTDLDHPAINRAGQIAFRAEVAGDGVDSTNDRGIWATDRIGDLQLLARTGDVLEVAPGDLRTLSDLDFVAQSANSDGRRSGFNNLGQLVFWASFTDGTEGVFVTSGVAGVPGDFNGNGHLDVGDLDALGDLTGDGVVDMHDRAYWVHELKRTWLGDTNLDGEFNSTDLIQIFAAGAYETDVEAGWSMGDFDGNRRINSSDLVAALADGGFEQGPRAFASAVPEPASMALYAVGLIFTAVARQRRVSHPR